MNCTSATIDNPVERFTAQFPTRRAAAKAAGITTEQLRKMRRLGYVSTRARAITMANAVGGRISAAALLAVAGRAS